MRRGPALALAGLVLLVLVSLWLQPDARRFSATSFGTVGGGHRALYELIEAAGLPAERGYEPPALVRERATVWWIEPWHGCEGPDAEALADFALRGGTAVVFLASRRALYAPDFALECAALGGRPLPPRLLPDDAETPDVTGSAPELQHVRGDGGYSRALNVPTLAVFEDTGGWQPRLRLRERPFALETRVGEGRLLVFADGTFLRNAWLDGGDAALLAFDVVRSFGTPLFDERAHGLRLAQSPGVLLARLGALPVFLGLLALAALWLWRRAAVPPGLPAPAPAVRPALEEFVASLAALYGRSRDWSQLAEHYRRQAVDRVRAHYGVSAELPLERLAAELRARGRAPEASLALLLPGAPARSRAEWLARARALDVLIMEVCR